MSTFIAIKGLSRRARALLAIAVSASALATGVLTLNPSAEAAGQPLVGYLDSAVRNSNGSVTVRGWALDSSQSDGRAVVLFNINGVRASRAYSLYNGSNYFLDFGLLTQSSRPDVNAVMGRPGSERHGFAYQLFPGTSRTVQICGAAANHNWPYNQNWTGLGNGCVNV